MSAQARDFADHERLAGSPRGACTLDRCRNCPRSRRSPAFLRERAVGRVVARVDVGRVQRAQDLRPAGHRRSHGLEVTGVGRHGKFLDLDVSGLHLVVHLARAGWLRWSDAAAAGARPARQEPARAAGAPRRRRSGLRPHRGRAPRSGSPSTSSATPYDVPGIARLGPDPLDPRSTSRRWRRSLAGSRASRSRALLRDQSVLAGVGNAYSDEVLHAAKLSPFALAGKLSEARWTVSRRAMRTVLTDAVEAAAGKPARSSRTQSSAGMRVHGRAGQACPVCGDTVREVSFADRRLQYCPTCQTGGKVLADRRLSRLLK